MCNEKRKYVSLSDRLEDIFFQKEIVALWFVHIKLLMASTGLRIDEWTSDYIVKRRMDRCGRQLG